MDHTMLSSTTEERSVDFYASRENFNIVVTPSAHILDWNKISLLEDGCLEIPNRALQNSPLYYPFHFVSAFAMNT